MPAKFAHALRPLFFTCAAAGVVLAVLAPLGTDQFSLLGRFSYWIGLCLAGGIGAGAVQYGLSRMGQKPSRWPLALAQSFGASAAVSLFIFQIHATPNLFSVASTLFYIWVIAMTISAVGAIQTKRDTTAASAQTQELPPALMSRLKPALRREDIYALEAQDHYVRVITSGGEDLLLMRLSDAITETAPLKGLSPHRSWWVAEDGVAEVSRRGGKAVIALKNSAEVPVSRSRLTTLKAQSWL